MDKTVTKKAESENVVAESVSDQPLLSEKTMVEEVQEEEMTIAKSTVANAAAEEGTSQQNTHGHIITWCRCECTARGSESSPRANVGDRVPIMASVLVRSRRFWNNSPEKANANTATVQEDAPVSEQ